MTEKLPTIIILIIILTSFLTYFNVLFNSFTYDDKFILSENRAFQSQKNLAFLFSRNYFNITQEFSYRPVLTLSYFISYKFFGLNSLPYHIENILLHTIVSLLCYFIFLGFFRNQLISLISTLLFVVHPVNSEVVNSIGYREDALSTLFFLASFLCFTGIIRRGISPDTELIVKKNRNCFIGNMKQIFLLISANLFFLLGLFSKENCVMLPILLFLYITLFSFGYEDRKYLKFVQLWLTSLIILVFYLIIRFWIIKYPVESKFNYIGGSLFISLLTTTVILVKYLLLIIFPMKLSVDYPISPISSLFNVQFLISLLVIILMLFVIFRLWKRNREASFFLAWFFITLIPTMNLVPILNPMAERYLYLPLIGICGFIGSLLITLEKKNQRLSLIFLLIIIFLFMLRTFIRNFDWRNDIILAKKTIQTMPNSAKSHYNLGCYYLSANVLSQAEEEFQKAIEIDKNFVPAYNNLGVIYMKLSQRNKALEYFFKALDIEPTYIKAAFGIGNVYYNIGEYNKAIQYYHLALQLNKNYPGVNVNLGNVYLKLGNYDTAIEYYRKALEIEPDNFDIKENIKIAEDLKKANEKKN